MKETRKKICAIICELNPMHTGHIHLIEEARKITNCDYLLGLMSGNFSQRSMPCVLDKFTRAKIAVNNGFDLMLNLPTAFCTNNAEIFALSSIKILNNLNIDFLAFGMETTNTKAIEKLVDFLMKETKEFKLKLKHELSIGNTYNNAVINTIKNNLNWFEKSIQKDVLDLISFPNNILAIEYLKAIKKTHSKIKPVIVKRANNYNSNELVENFISASKIRQELSEKNYDNFIDFVPKNSIDFLKENNIDISLFNNLILYSIKSKKTKQIKSVYSVNEGLENKLKKEANKTSNFITFRNQIKTKRYKENKINAILLNTLLNINKKTIKKLYTIKSNIMVKTLALNAKKGDIFKYINTKYLITRKKDVNKHINKYNKKLFEIENNANIVYNLISNNNLIENDIYNKMVVVNK